MMVKIENGSTEQIQELGLKGAYLCDMARMGLSVPPGFIIPTSACRDFYNRGRSVPDELLDEIKQNLIELEAKTGRTYGGGEKPLLLSVRSGAPVPMPGMMDTLLNLGVVQEKMNDLEGARDTYLRSLRADPSSANTYYNLAVLYWKQGNWAEVVRAFKRMLEINPGDIRARQYLPAAMAKLKAAQQKE